VAAIRMQIFLILHARCGYLGSNCLRLAAKRKIDLACIAASRMQNLHTLAAIALQSRQFCAIMQYAGRINIEEKKKLRKNPRKLKILRGNRAFRGLFKRTKHIFLRTYETVPLNAVKKHHEKQSRTKSSKNFFFVYTILSRSCSPTTAHDHFIF